MLTVVENMCTETLANVADSKAIIQKGGNQLVVSCKWPRLMTTETYLHKFWYSVNPDGKKGNKETKAPAFPDWHSKIIAFEKLYKQMKESKSKDIWSHAYIDLPFQVQEDEMDLHQIGDKTSGAFVLYLNSKAYSNSKYNMGKDKSIMMLD